MEFDYVIVGAGSAGCVLAARLSEDASVRVALVEAGGADSSALITAPAGFALMAPLKVNNWGYETVPQAGLNGRRGYQPRGKVVGGSSSINAMVYLRGHQLDYDGWAAGGATGWSWHDVLPYFIKAEHNERGASAVHGVGGPLNVADLRTPNPIAQQFIDAAREAGFPLSADFNGGDTEGVGPFQVTQKGGERWSAARGYLRPALQRPNLALITGALTRRIVFDGKRAVGVEIERGGVIETLRAQGEIIISAGAFGSPQLLMCSGIGPADHLQERGVAVLTDAPGVGQNLQDHIDYIINRRYSSTDLYGLSFGGAWRLLREIGLYRRERRGMVTSNFAETGGFIKTLPTLPKPDIQFHFVIGMVDNHNRTTHTGHGYSIHACVLNPKSTGEVRLAGGDTLGSKPGDMPGDMRAAPLIDPKFFSHADDMATMKRGFKAMRAVLNAPALVPYRGPELYTEGLREDDDAGVEAAIRARADTIYHPVGTCKMGTDAMAVVDPQLRVRGVEGLRVIDASVMPTLTSGNTNAPTIMIAEKGANLLRAKI